MMRLLVRRSARGVGHPAAAARMCDTARSSSIPQLGTARTARLYPHTDEEIKKLNPVGGLICVNMQNFMCHRNFTQNFYSGVNYITGENGSGKSAVIVAISAALGANFSKIGKGDDVSSCIGTADPISVITVVLRNDPLNPRHCNKYGNPVVVERTLVRRGEVGKISNKNTIKIDGKEVRKCDLMELMAIMSIDVGNPAVVLNQDDAKSFGDGNDSKDLYKYFLDATGLRQSLDECEKCKKQVLADKANISQCIEVQKKIEEGDYAVAKRDKEKCSNLNDLRNKIDELVADLSVLEVYDVVKKLDEKSEDLREYQETRVKLDAQIAQLALELDSMRAEESAVELQGKAELDAEMNSIVQQLQHLTKKAKEFTTEHGRKNTEKAQAEATIRRIEKQIHDEEKARDAAREEFERQDRNKGKRMAAKMKEEAEGCLQKVQQRQDELHSLEGETEECEHEIRRTQTQFDDIKSNISNLDERMRKNKSSRGKVITREEIIRRYAQPHSQSVDLVQARNAIDAAQKRGIFRGSTPVGPLGLHITLKPEGRRFCKPIFQSIGVKALGAFLFESVDDREAFKKSKEFQAIPNGSSLTMYVLPSSVHNEPEFVPSFEAVPGSSTYVCMDLLNFDNLWVKNAVLQFAKLDQCHVVDQYDKTLGHRAQAALRSRPRLTVVVRAIDGHETRAAINSVQSTTNNFNVPSDIFDRSETIDAEASLREMESEKQHLTRDYQRMDKERRESTNALKQLKDREQRLNSEIATYQKKRKQLLADAREQEIEAEALPQEFDESSFDEAIQSKRATLDARKEEVLRCLSELEVISKNQSQVQDQMKKEVKKRENVEQKLQRQQQVQDEAERKQQEKQRDKDKLSSKSQQIFRLMAPIQAEVSGLQNHINAWLVSKTEQGFASIEVIRTKAQEICSRARGISPQSLQKTISSEKKAFKQQEASLALPEGGVETINARFRELEEKLDNIQREVAVHRTNYSELMKTHMKLHSNYVTLRDFLSGTVELAYQEYLSKKNYEGKLVFDHDKLTMISSVDVNTRDGAKSKSSFAGHKQLSGGENSYSNVCLLLAFSSVSPCPWQVLDEFDVFMDQNHRALALQLICDSMTSESGAAMCKNQLVFITPHSIPREIAENPEVHVSVVVRPSQSESR